MASSSDTAHWTESRHQTFVQLCVEEVKKGNRPTSSFNKIGWSNIIDGLNRFENVRYQKIQVKNHFTSTKKDYLAWVKLESETGLGRDPITGTITCEEDRWKILIQQNPSCKHFRNKPIAHLDELRLIFGGTHATGEHSWAPSHGTHPSFDKDDEELRTSNAGPSKCQKVIDIEGCDSSDLDGGICQKKKSSNKCSKSQQSSSRKRKESASDKLDYKLLQLCEYAFKSNDDPHLPTPQASTTPTIKECLAILNNMADEITDELFILGTNAFKDPDNRDIWMYMAPQKRNVWLESFRDPSKS